jgi:hypothetical protein
MGLATQVELLASSGSGDFSTEQGGDGFHHPSGWVGDIGAAIDKLGNTGVTPETIARFGHQTVSTFFDPEGMLGIRSEADKG